MKKRIEKLTKEQIDRIAAIRDEWLSHGLSTAPADFDKTEEAAKAAYIAVGLAPPRIFIRLRSPIEGVMAAALLENSKFSPQVRAQVGDQVRAQVRDQVRAQVWDQVRAQVWDQVWRAMYGQHDAAWLSFFDYFRVALGLTAPEKLQPLMDLARSCGWAWFFKGACILTDRPEILCRDEAGRLHSETGPALRYRGGFSIYGWHGTRVPSHWIENRKGLDPNEVIKADNVEQRAAGAAICGWPKMFSVLKAEVIDDSGNEDIGQLIEVKLPGLRTAGRFLKAKCPRNGIIVEGVPRVSEIDGLPIETALAAQAWRVGDPQAEYIHPPART